MIQSPAAIAETWLFTTLNGDTLIHGGVNGIFPVNALQGTLTPYITYTLKIAPTVKTMGQTIVWWNCHYIIDLVINNDDIIGVDPIAVQISNLLHKGNGVTTGGKVISSTVESMDQYQSNEGGVDYRHLVQFYEILVQPNLS